MKAIIVMNENHSIMEEQLSIIEKEFEKEYEFLKVPSTGWTKNDMDEVIEKITSSEYGRENWLDVVFVSPIPYMIRELTRREIYAPSAEYCEDTGLRVRIFHNDHREKKELPNGQIIQVVSKSGWQLV